ncbi:hypothetical protein DJ018_05830 [Phenylobacterium deserti]|uniref:Uncharacterized protein n=1 Tax=Phenylobacterium deserti TaxID=1914756 RepID=A0A328AX74_9CAUL|nr:hypothetical protein DJ018_05830 [Phenylobacterium deserti]
MILAAILMSAAVVSPEAAGTQVRTPNFYSAPAHCENAPYKVVDRFGRPVFQTLNRQPPGALQLAVNRRVNGCPVATVVHGIVEPDQPQPPSEDYRLRRGGGR